MPLYEYQCQSCSDLSEVIQRMSDPPLETCESCGGELKKLLSAPAFQFKGSGWYVTDYGKGGSSNGKDGSKSESSESKSDSGGSSKSDSSSSSKSSKPEAKTKAERVASG